MKIHKLCCTTWQQFKRLVRKEKFHCCPLCQPVLQGWLTDSLNDITYTFIAYLPGRIPEVTRQNLGELAFSLVQHFTHSVAETNNNNEPEIQGAQHRAYRQTLTTQHFRQGPEFWRRQTVSVRQHSRALAGPEAKSKAKRDHCKNQFNALCQ